ncbi:reverse transcriptase/maturase family protein [Candidatus Gracilibacteria bacterium]|jgi:retron-type reverse transcriptase|nr:reverse transcriptase/maturase family protein [Candidatus Gracilibacteria bacterium]
MSIDLSLKNIWGSWFVFRKGKHSTSELQYFQYNLEKNLYKLFIDLNAGKYKHGGYRKFIVCDNKKREISVADIRDRVVHRLIYDYLNKIYDKTFIYDAWSCRLKKGLMGAIERTQTFLRCYPNSYIWKCDVKKFFDSVDQEILLGILDRKIKDKITINLIREIIRNFGSVKYGKIGMPIGNLTSQIFANIYLNELDRFVKHIMKPKEYLRYGDDFILVEKTKEKLNFFRTEIINFLKNELKLTVNTKSDKIIKPSHTLKFLGINLLPAGRILNKRSLSRATQKLNPSNISSYSGLIKKHCDEEYKKYFDWKILELF